MRTEREAWADKIREAERIAQKKKYHPPEPKVDWLSTNCTHCGGKILYSPKPTFKGRLHCPHCGKDFVVPRLDDYTEEKTTLDNFKEEAKK